MSTTTLQIGPLVLGGNTFGWTSDETESFAVLDAFLDQGGCFVDTADVYSAWAPGHRGGESEEMIGRWLARRPRGRDAVSIGTKVGRHPRFAGLERANVLAGVDASLTRLGVERIDMYYPHYDDPTVAMDEIVDVFHDLQSAGKIRHVGLSNMTPARVTEWFDVASVAGYEPPMVIQPHYNLVFRHEYESSLASVVDERGLSVIPYFSLASGLLSGKHRTMEDVQASARSAFTGRYVSPESLAVVGAVIEVADAHGVAPATVALAWLRSRPHVAAPIASARTVEQLPALMAAATLTLDVDELARLDELSARIPE